MAILAFDTCLRSVSAAVNLDGRITSRFEACETGHAERLMPLIEAVLADAGIAFGDVTRIAVTLGPGGFTGLRVGISAARGFALALGVPVVGLTSLHVAALGAAQQLATLGHTDRFVVAAPAGRDGVFAQVFGGDHAAVEAPPRLIWPDESVSDLAGAAVLGPGAALLEGRAPGLIAVAAFAGLQPNAADLARVAPDLTPLADVRPLYLRAADAKPQTATSQTTKGQTAKVLARAADSRQS